MKRVERLGEPVKIEKRLVWTEPYYPFLLIFMVAMLIGLLFEPFNQPSRNDPANWDYFAQVLARGGVPYRDVVNIKSPLSAYLGVAAIIAGKLFGVSDVIAIRLGFIALAALTTAFTYIVTLNYFENRRIAWLAATLLLACGGFSRFNTAGVQPKTPMILFGLISLWAIIKDRPFTAGLFAMLSALCWQPGLLFAGAAGLAFSRYFTNWRDGKILKLIYGAAVPLAVLLVYFLVTGALKDFYLWNIHFNATVYAPGEMHSLGNFIEHFPKLAQRVYGNSFWQVYLATAGLLLAFVLAITQARREGRKGWSLYAPQHAIIIAPIVYLIFCRINIQGGADLIPLMPFVAVFAAVALVYAMEWLIALLAAKRVHIKQARVANVLTAIGLTFIFLQTVNNARAFKRDFPTLKDQQQALTDITSRLTPEDKIFVYGGTEVLVLSGLTNASKYFLLDKGKDRYLDRVEPGGFTGWLERLKAERPKVVVLDRLDKSDYLNLLVEWVASEYELRNNSVFSYYVRKM